MRRTVCAALALLTLGACSSTTGGHGALAPRSPASSGLPSSAAGPAPTDSVPSTVASSPVASPTRGALSCAPGSVTTTGAPFCYPLPRGFADVSTQTNYGDGWTYRTLISVGGHDLIEVLGSIYSTDTDTLNDTQLRALYNGAGLLQQGKLGFASVSAVQPTTVDGARAFAQDGEYTTGVSSHDVRIYTGRTIVFISCQSMQKQTAVQAACNQVIEQIQLART